MAKGMDKPRPLYISSKQPQVRKEAPHDMLR